ncbi:MATE family efflux transporter [Bacillus sonorensis]|uniref:MATE family efflux transporter n=1 Tax=Bacillus sonorensis TaxID=119858 RepID=UPI002DB6793B|nr:MATE family efflux transporter [Bacillus sonorensis]MEC1428224.1 MATE family efflux transporter [Bacillus sonorensis]
MSLLNKTFILNLGANMASFLLSVLFSMWLTPFVIQTLGVEAFGFVHLTQNMINYFSIITVALSAVVVRFFSVSAHRGALDEARGYMNTYIVSSIILSFILFFPLAGTSFFIDRIIRVPAALLSDVQMALFIGGLLFLLTFFMSGFAAGPFYANKIYITSTIQAVQMLIRVLSVLCIFSWFAPKIWHIQLAAFIATAAACMLSIIFFKKLIPWFAFRIRDMSIQKCKKLLQSGGWSSVSQIGVLLFLQIDLMVANIMLGVSESGMYAAIIQFPLLLRTLSGTLAAVFSPTITLYYSKGDKEGLVRYANRAVRFNGMILALPAALLGGLAGPFLTLWLGPSFEHLKWLLLIHAGYLVVSLSPAPLFYIFTAYNKLRTPALTTVAFGAVNLLLAVVLSGPAGLGLYGIALSGAVALMLKNVVFTPIYASKITGETKRVFYKGVYAPLAGASFTLTVCCAIQLLFAVDSLPSLIMTALTASGAYTLFAYFVMCTKEERLAVHAWLHKFRTSALLPFQKGFFK